MALAAAQSSKNKLIEAFALNIASLAHVQVESVSTALQMAEAGMALSRKLGNPLYEALSFASRGRVYAALGLYKEAIADRLHARELYQAIGDELGEILTSMQLAQTLYESGDYAQSLSVANETIHKAEQRGVVFYQAYSLYWKGLSHCALAQFDEAKQAIEQVAQVSQANNMPNAYRRLIQIGNAEIALRRGSATSALDYIDQIVSDILEKKPHTTNVELMRFVTLCDVLIANNDPRTAALLTICHDRIMRSADTITNPAYRRTYLEQSCINRHLLAHYAALKT